MWLLIDKESTRVLSITDDEPQPDSYNADVVVVKEWDGPAPAVLRIVDGMPVPGDLDPTLDDPDYEPRIAVRAQSRIDASDLLTKIDTELDWLEEVIPQIDAMSLEELRDVLKRLARENQYQIKAWRYVLTHLDHLERRNTC
jgi:hypothetical protein